MGPAARLRAHHLAELQILQAIAAVGTLAGDTRYRYVIGACACATLCSAALNECYGQAFQLVT